MTLLAGCSRGCGRDHPYTPYVIDSSPLAPSAALSAVARDAGPPVGLGGDAGGFVHVVGVRPDAPDGAFRIDGATLVAPPPGETFVLAFATNLDGDGARDAVAWVTAGNPLAGRLLFYKGNPNGSPPGEPQKLALLASGSLGGATCAPEPALEQIGPHTVAVSMHALCPPPAPSKKLRWIAVATPIGEPPLREELFLGDPPEGERLEVTLDSSDLDGDHRDNLVVHVALEGAPRPFEPGARTVADLRWLDRPTGLSRDAEEPEASLRRAASALAARSTKKGDAAGIPAGARAIERLYAWLCSDGGDPLVTASSGAIRCGTSRALEDALLARTRAALTLGNISRAVSAYERLGWLPATTTKQRRAEVEKALLKAAPTRVPAATRVLATLPDIEAGVGPAWGPLMFTPFGSLLVRARGGLATVDVQTGTETAAQAIPSWPAAVTNLEGTLRWLGLYDPCDGVALRVRLGPTSEPPFVVPAGPAPPGRIRISRCPSRRHSQGDALPGVRLVSSTRFPLRGRRPGSKRGWPVSPSSSAPISKRAHSPTWERWGSRFTLALRVRRTSGRPCRGPSWARSSTRRAGNSGAPPISTDPWRMPICATARSPTTPAASLVYATAGSSSC